ncbi:Nn.00g046100.m01.CDS01 [Neocucurbitaria sp. VM-36]
MTPRTRPSNTDADFKVYYSKKVPQQVHFPHKQKTVRKRSTPVRDASEKRQMVFLPDKMRAKCAKVVKDSDTESESEDEHMQDDGEVMFDWQAVQEAELNMTGVAKGKGKKRKTGIINVESEEIEELVIPTPKRRRKTVAKKLERRFMPFEADSEVEHDATPPKTKRTGDKSKRLSRQSTLTQLVDERRLSPNKEEPDFKPVKRSLTMSHRKKSRRKGGDKQQRTLTQMIPGMRELESVSDEDLKEEPSDFETQEKGGEDYGAVVAQRLARQGLHHVEGGVGVNATSMHQVDEGKQLPTYKKKGEDEVQVEPATAVQSVEHVVIKEEEDSYKPTQYIDAPVTRTGRTPRRRKNKQDQTQKLADTTLPIPPRSSNSRFGLLSTPEKRRIREIPSSQSPADSPLSTQMSSHKTDRSPLKERSGNEIQTLETPSRRKKVVSIEPSKERNSPPILSRLRSTVQDSEEEDEGMIEDEALFCAQRINAHTQALLDTTNRSKYDEAVGSQTQAIVEQIPQACARADDVCLRGDKDICVGVPTPIQRHFGTSPELDEQPNALQHKHNPLTRSSHRTASVAIKQELLDCLEMLSGTTVDPSLLQGKQPAASTEPMNEEVESSTQVDERYLMPPGNEPYLQDTFPSTPMVIQDESSDDDDATGSMSPSRAEQDTLKLPSTNRTQPSTDLHDEPVQVPVSPSTQRETQQSHSSKAEQQLQDEWLSYSQYVNTRPPQSSSMHVGADAFSYNATPMPPRPADASLPQSSGRDLSQATTVDELTPKKNRRQRSISAKGTPHKAASSQPFISPSKPPPIFIPSSFPSPAKAGSESWSSPVYGRTQDYRSSQFGGSIEDFSIPLPPPMEGS